MLGIFSFQKETWSSKPLRWLDKFDFSHFYMDNHLTTVMFLDKERKNLDYNFLLWKFDTSKLDHFALAKMDKGSAAAENQDELEEVKKKPCCLLF